MVVGISAINVDNGFATIKMKNLSADFTPVSHSVRVELHRKSDYSECTFVVLVDCGYWIANGTKNTIPIRLGNFKSCITENGHLVGQWNYDGDGGFYRIYDSAKEMIGIDSKIGEGSLPEFT